MKPGTIPYGGEKASVPPMRERRRGVPRCCHIPSPEARFPARMPTVVFAAPYFLEATLMFVDAAASLPGVRFGLVSTDPEDKLPKELRRKLSAHYRVADTLDPSQLATAVRAISTKLGAVDRLIGSLEQLQVPLAEARAALGIPGMSVEAAHNFRDKGRMKTVLREAGLPCARHRLAGSAAAAAAFGEEGGFP